MHLGGIPGTLASVFVLLTVTTTVYGAERAVSGSPWYQRTYDSTDPLDLEIGQVITAEPDGAGRFRIWGLGQAGGPFEGSFEQKWEEDNWPSKVLVVDLDGDGEVNEIVAGILAGYGPDFIIFVNVYRHNPSGNAFLASSYNGANWLYLSRPVQFSLSAGNLDDDAGSEIVLVGGEQIAVLDYSPEGQRLEKVASRVFQKMSFASVVVGDFDGDGADEIATSGNLLDGSGRLDLYDSDPYRLSDPVQFELQSPFYAPEMSTSETFLAGPTDAGDANGDGREELWVVTYGSPGGDIRLEGFTYDPGEQSLQSIFTGPGSAPVWYSSVPVSRFDLGDLNRSLGDEIALVLWDNGFNSIQVLAWDEVNKRLEAQTSRQVLDGSIWVDDVEIGDLDPSETDGSEIVLAGDGNVTYVDPSPSNALAESGDFYLEALQLDQRFGETKQKALRIRGAGPEGDDPGESWVTGIDIVRAQEVEPEPVSTVFFPVSLDRPAAGGSRLNTDTFVGVAVANLSLFRTSLSVLGVAENGGVSNSASLSSVGANAQRAFLTSEVVEGDSSATGILIQSGEEEIEGFFMVGRNDLQMLDGVGGVLPVANTLFFPFADRDSSRSVVLCLNNPSGESTAKGTLELHGSDGALLRSSEIELSPSGTWIRAIEEVFGADLEILGGYLKLVADQPLRGFELVRHEDALSAIAGQVGQSVNRFVAPHFFFAGNGGSRLRLLNAGEAELDATLIARRDDGSELGRADFSVGSKALFSRALTELLGSDASNDRGGEPVSGYLVLDLTSPEATSPNAVGALTFAGSDDAWVSTLPLQSEGSSRVDFLHVAHSEEVGMFTGLAILNSGAGPAAVQVEVFDENGARGADKQIQIPAGQRVVDLLGGPVFFGADFSQVKGHIKVRSDQPVHAFALFGSNNLSFMAAIEGQR